jgi:hypothetical protein
MSRRILFGLTERKTKRRKYLVHLEGRISWTEAKRPNGSHASTRI